MSEVKHRLLQYLQYKDLSQREFADTLGVSNAYIGAMRRSISDDKVRKIRQSFPDLNTDWLLYGEGNMLRQDTTLSVHGGHNDGTLIPLLPVDAFAGRLQDYSTGVGLADCEMIVSPVRGADYAIRVSGDSMEPKIHDGSTILIKRINDKAFIPWGNSMVIDSENGVLVKDVYPDEDNPHCIAAKSINPKYPTLSIPRNSIYGLYRILASIQVFGSI